MASSKEESNDEELTEQEALENQEDASEVAESLVDREESAPKSENKLLSFSKKLPNLQAYRDKKLRKRLILLVSLF